MSKQTGGEISATPWHTGGTFNPDSEDPRQNVWAKTAPGYQSGDIVARWVRPADARLISAAPDLLAALKSITSAFNTARIIMADKEARDLAGEIVAECRAAITKAEGRS